MIDIGFMLLLALWSTGLGLSLLRLFAPTPEEPVDALALALPLGLGTLGLALLGLGESGRLDARGIEALLIVGGLMGVSPLFRWMSAVVRTRRERIEVQDRLDLAFAIALVVVLGGTLLTALGPVTDGDALCYHLQVPKRFLMQGSVFFDPDLHETVYPLLTEMLYALALGMRGPIACRLVSWLLGIAFALNVVALARPILGRRAWWAATIALLVPAVSNGMGAPLNDVALAAFGVAALHAWSRFHAAPGLRLAALTGVMTGLSLGVKYPALVLAGLIGLTFAPGLFSGIFIRLLLPGPPAARRRLARFVSDWSVDPEQRRRRLIHLFAFVAFTVSVGGGWYARALFHTGNPVHPFFRNTFGGAGLDEVLGPEKRPLPVDPWHVLTALAPMTLNPHVFDNVSHEFGPVFLLFLPALFLERPPRRLLAVGAIAFAFLAVCLTQRQSMRFVLTAVGPLSIGVAWLAARWWERRSRPGIALVGTLLLILTYESALAAARARHGATVAFGIESGDAYLARREPTYRVGRWIEENLPTSTHLVGQDHRGFYFPREYTMELAHRRRTGLGTKGEAPADILTALRRAGFTHLLLCPPIPETAVEFDPTLGRLLSPWLATHTPVFRDDLADTDGVVRRYAIYSLPSDGVARR